MIIGSTQSIVQLTSMVYRQYMASQLARKATEKNLGAKHTQSSNLHTLQYFLAFSSIVSKLLFHQALARLEAE